MCLDWEISSPHKPLLSMSQAKGFTGYEGVPQGWFMHYDVGEEELVERTQKIKENKDFKKERKEEGLVGEQLNGAPNNNPPFLESQLLPLSQHPSPHNEPLTSSKMRFLARVIAELRALIHDSFSSGLTARKIRLGACEGKSLVSAWVLELAPHLDSEEIRNHNLILLDPAPGRREILLPESSITQGNPASTPAKYHSLDTVLEMTKEELRRVCGTGDIRGGLIIFEIFICLRK